MAACKAAAAASILSETVPDHDDAGDELEELHENLATPINAKPNRALTRVESNERAKRASEGHVEVQRRVRPSGEQALQDEASPSARGPRPGPRVLSSGERGARAPCGERCE